MGSARVSPCQHLLSVPDGDGQQGWSTRSPAQHPWGPLFPKPFGHSHTGGTTSPVGLWHPEAPWLSVATCGLQLLLMQGTFQLQYK